MELTIVTYLNQSVKLMLSITCIIGNYKINYQFENSASV